MIREKSPLSVRALCEAFTVSASGYYRFAAARVTPRRRRRDEMTAFIRERFAESKDTYGCRRIRVLLQRAGWRVNRKTVAAIMRELGRMGVPTAASSPRPRTVTMRIPSRPIS